MFLVLGFGVPIPGSEFPHFWGETGRLSVSACMRVRICALIHQGVPRAEDPRGIDLRKHSGDEARGGIEDPCDVHYLPEREQVMNLILHNLYMTLSFASHTCSLHNLWDANESAQG